MSIRRQPFPESFINPPTKPENRLRDVRYSTLPIMRFPVDVANKEHMDKVTQLAQSRHMNVRDFLQQYESPSPEAGVGVQVYRLTDRMGVYSSLFFSRESLHDGPQLRAFDYVWSHQDQLHRIGVDRKELPFDTSSDQLLYLIPDHYVRLHKLLCREDCNNEWHPRSEDMVSVLGNLGGEDEKQFTLADVSGTLPPQTPEQDLLNLSNAPQLSPTSFGGSLLSPLIRTPLMMSFMDASAPRAGDVQVDTPIVVGWDALRDVPLTPNSPVQVEESEVEESEVGESEAGDRPME